MSMESSIADENAPVPYTPTEAADEVEQLKLDNQNLRARINTLEGAINNLGIMVDEGVRAAEQVKAYKQMVEDVATVCIAVKSYDHNARRFVKKIAGIILRDPVVPVGLKAPFRTVAPIRNEVK